jgi:glutaredoxin
MMRIIPQILVLGLFAVLAGVRPAAAQDASGALPAGAGSPVAVHLFWSETCPHCSKAKAFLEQLARRDPGIALDARELSGDRNAEMAFVALSLHFGVDPPAVPLVVVGERVFVGYDEDETTGAAIAEAIAGCLEYPCADEAAVVIARMEAGGEAGPPATGARFGGRALPETVSLPLVGEVRLRSLSLPVLTLVLGAVDGFNPCAMWVLVFLIGLLLGLRDQVRMWSYGAVFLLTSAAVYFAFMAAWLNLFLVLGTLDWIRAGIGIFALAGGGYYLWQFVANPDAVCPVTSPGERQSIMGRLRQAVTERSFILAAGGIAVLAVAVNLVELLCSAGIPALYTHVLSLSELPPGAYYGYLLLYIAVFLVDDAIVFVTAMVTLRAAGLAAGYARYSHLIGGVVLGGIGLALLFRPQWLAFA